MHRQVNTMERWGRIVLSLAVLALFLSITASMIAGRFLVELILGILLIGALGWLAMAWGRRAG